MHDRTCLDEYGSNVSTNTKHKIVLPEPVVPGIMYAVQVVVMVKLFITPIFLSVHSRHP